MSHVLFVFYPEGNNAKEKNLGEKKGMPLRYMSGVYIAGAPVEYIEETWRKRGTETL